MQMQSANAHLPTLTLDLTAARHVTRWHGVHTVLPATHTFIHEWYESPCMHLVSIHQSDMPYRIVSYQRIVQVH